MGLLGTVPFGYGGMVLYVWTTALTCQATEAAKQDELKVSHDVMRYFLRSWKLMFDVDVCAFDMHDGMMIKPCKGWQGCRSSQTI